MNKVLVLHNIISPVRAHQFNEMNKFYEKNNVDFKVVFLSESDKNRHWNKFDIRFKYEVLDNFALRVGKKDLYTFFINPSILGLLKKEKPNKIICFNWDHFAAFVANYWAIKNGCEFILWSGSTEYEKSWRRTLFMPLIKYLVKKSDKCIGDGTRHRDYLIKLGAEPKNVTHFYFQVDVDYFEKKSKDFTILQRKLLKERIGIHSSKIIFFNGQLIERKGVFDLLQAFKLYLQKENDISLLLLGRGREKKRMQSIIKNEHIANVFFADFVEYDEVYQYYAISDIFILPSSEEAWGLVVNEAMACGLPVITTTVTGCSVDLVEEARNGYIIKPNSPEDIVTAIQKIFENNLDKTNNSLQKIKKINIVDMISQTAILSF